MERATQNSCLLKELALQTHTRQGICMQGDLCYHFKYISLLIVMEWSDSHVNSATDMCFRDYCVFWKGNVHVMRRQNHAAMFKIIALQKKVSELQ